MPTFIIQKNLYIYFQIIQKYFTKKLNQRRLKFKVILKLIKLKKYIYKNCGKDKAFKRI